MLLAHNLADIGDIVLRRHEIGQVAHLQHVKTARDNRLVATLDSHHMIRVVRTAEVLQRLVQYLCLTAHLDAKQHQGTAMHIPTLTYP